MAGRRNVKGQKGDENMPKLQEKSNVADQASNAKSARASTGGQATAHLSDTRPSMAPEDIITAINELKTDIKKGNEAVKNEIVGLRQEINGKLDKLATEVQGLSDRVEETETRLSNGSQKEKAGGEMACFNKDITVKAKHAVIRGTKIFFMRCTEVVMAKMCSEPQALQRCEDGVMTSVQAVCGMSSKPDRRRVCCGRWRRLQALAGVTVGVGVRDAEAVISGLSLCEPMAERQHSAGKKCQKHSEANRLCPTAMQQNRTNCMRTYLGRKPSAADRSSV
ncbi:hypothetical protein D9C73_010162 [Collichthys lucidus]|uniref:Uncharacterized protein n=1 Tax=Collichthys lucidus TaxID=240159 RepID=A0A4U5ULB7_COLLU|nr:hypothetical protein D9C73_010162 [Collichthys lucidus]